MNLLGNVIVGVFVAVLALMFTKGRDWGLVGDVIMGGLSALNGGLLFGGGVANNMVVWLFSVITLVAFRVKK